MCSVQSSPQPGNDWLSDLCVASSPPSKSVTHLVFRSMHVGLIKVHLTPNFFFAQINLHIMWSKLPQKFFDLLESSIFYRWSKYGKFNKNAAILVHVRVLGTWD